MDAAASTEDLAAQLAKLEKEEAALLEARAQAGRTSLAHSIRDVERCLEGVRRGLPDLDVVAKTAGELRTSIRKTMERADVVSVKVRELDQSRSRALQALEYAKRCVEARECVKGAKDALARKDLEVAAGFVQRFDDVSKSDTLPGANEMAQIRTDLQRLILDSHAHDPTSPSLGHQRLSSLRGVAAQSNWLEADAVKEALKQASVMSKVSDSTGAVTRYAHFLSSYLRERITAEIERVQFAKFEEGNVVDDSKVFVDTLKYLLNSAAALIDVNTRIPEAILPTSSRPIIFKAVNVECDRQCTYLFDGFMTGRRLHERAGRQDVEKDLGKLSHLLVEICIAMQHVETYDRFLRSRPFFNPSEHNPEYRRIVQEVAGSYTLLEKKWIVESLRRAKKAESIVQIIVSGRPIEASSLVEDAFYVCRRAVKRALGTGSSQATGACVNLIAACLEDSLLPAFSTSSSSTGMSAQTSLDSIVASSTVQINSLELSADYCTKMFNHIIATDAFERADELAKVKSCAEGLLELSDRFEAKRLEAIGAFISQMSSLASQYRQALEAIEQANFHLDDQQFEREDNFATRVGAVAGVILSGRLKESVSDMSFERLVETLSSKVADDLEKGIIIGAKRFTQLGALKFERDLRHISEAFISIVANSLVVRAIFARLMQIASMLSVAALEEAHDVWDSFTAGSSSASSNVLGDIAHSRSIRPKERLNAKEVKRVLGLRVDFEQREIQRLKLL